MNDSTCAHGTPASEPCEACAIVASRVLGPLDQHIPGVGIKHAQAPYDADERERWQHAQHGAQVLERTAAMAIAGGTVEGNTFGLAITDDMVQRGLAWYRAHMLDDVAGEVWMRQLLEAAFRP